MKALFSWLKALAGNPVRVPSTLQIVAAISFDIARQSVGFGSIRQRGGRT